MNSIGFGLGVRAATNLLLGPSSHRTGYDQAPNGRASEVTNRGGDARREVLGVAKSLRVTAALDRLQLFAKPALRRMCQPTLRPSVAQNLVNVSCRELREKHLASRSNVEWSGLAKGTAGPDFVHAHDLLHAYAFTAGEDVRPDCLRGLIPQRPHVRLASCTEIGARKYRGRKVDHAVTEAVLRGGWILPDEVLADHEAQQTVGSAHTDSQPAGNL